MPMKPIIAQVNSGLIGLPFGSTQSAVSRAFGESPTVVDKIGRRYEFFRTGALSIQYDRRGQFEAIEFHPPTVPGSGPDAISIDDVFIEVANERILPFRMSAWKFLDWIRLRDPAVTVEHAGFKSEKFGVSVYADWLAGPPGPKRETDPVKTVMVFREGYYSQSAALEAREQIMEWMRANGIEPAPERKKK